MQPRGPLPCRDVSKKLTRSQRRELREKGRLPTAAPRVKQAQRVAERQAEEEAVSARVAEARGEVHDAEEKRGEARGGTRAKRRDLTVLVLLGLTAIAAIIFYLSQRAPSTDEPQPKPRASAAPAPPAGEPQR